MAAGRELEAALLEARERRQQDEADKAKRLGRAISAVIDGDIPVDKAATAFKVEYRVLQAEVRRRRGVPKPAPPSVREMRAVHSPQRPSRPADIAPIPVGTKVRVTLNSGRRVVSTVKREPWRFHGGWMVQLDGVRSPVALWRVTVLEKPREAP